MFFLLQTFLILFLRSRFQLSRIVVDFRSWCGPQLVYHTWRPLSSSVRSSVSADLPRGCLRSRYRRCCNERAIKKGLNTTTRDRGRFEAVLGCSESIRVGTGQAESCVFSSFIVCWFTKDFFPVCGDDGRRQMLRRRWSIVDPVPSYFFFFFVSYQSPVYIGVQ